MKGFATVTTLLIVIASASPALAKPKVFQGYLGAELPSTEVATIELSPGLLFMGVDQIEPKKSMRAPRVAVQSGTHTFRIGTADGGYRLVKAHSTGGVVSLDLSILSDVGCSRTIVFSVAAGHQYTVSTGFAASSEGDLPQGHAALNRSNQGFGPGASVYVSGRPAPVSKEVYIWRTEVHDANGDTRVEVQVDDSKLLSCVD